MAKNEFKKITTLILLEIWRLKKIIFFGLVPYKNTTNKSGERQRFRISQFFKFRNCSTIPDRQNKYLGCFLSTSKETLKPVTFSCKPNKFPENG